MINGWYLKWITVYFFKCYASCKKFSCYIQYMEQSNFSWMSCFLQWFVVLIFFKQNRKQPLLWVQGDIFRSTQKSRSVEEDNMSKVVSGLDDISISGSINKVENFERFLEVTGIIPSQHPKIIFCIYRVCVGRYVPSSVWMTHSERQQGSLKLLTSRML